MYSERGVRREERGQLITNLPRSQTYVCILLQSHGDEWLCRWRRRDRAERDLVYVFLCWAISRSPPADSVAAAVSGEVVGLPLPPTFGGGNI